MVDELIFRVLFVKEVHVGSWQNSERQRKREKNEGFGNLHIILQIHAYALAKIHKVN